MSVKIFNDLEIYKIVRESVLRVQSGVLRDQSVEEFAKLAEKFSGEVKTAVKGITDLMLVGYPQNKADVDWMDFKDFFEEVDAGKFIVSESEKSAADAMENILQKIPATKNLLMNIIGDENKFDMLDVNDATQKLVKKFPDAEIVWGVTADESFANKIFIVMVMEVI